MPLDVQVVSPERVLYEGVADMVVCRPEGGDVAFLPGHVPFLGALAEGAVRVILNADAGQGAGEVAFAVHGGFVEVSNDHVTVLSDLAEAKDQIDVARAEKAKTTAEAILANDPEDEAALAALGRATTRVHVATEL